MSEPENNSGCASKVDDDDPPPLSIQLPKRSNLPRKSKDWSDVQLPVDILLLTVEDCEFLACYHYLRNSFRSYHNSLGYVYFGSMGDEERPLTVALMTRSSGPGGSQALVRNAVTQLLPKATFSVGFCSGLNHEKTKLGDVVVSSTLATDAYKTPVSRYIASFVRGARDGWEAPLESPEVREVNVHCDGVILSCPDLVNTEQQRKLHPDAIAVEMEGKGIFAAAHDMKLEWVIVKGVSDFAINSSSSTHQSWKGFACAMAASVVSNMLSDPVVFKQWPHYGEEDSSTITPKKDSPFSSSQDAKRRKLMTSDHAAINDYTSALKASVKSQTEFQTKSMGTPTISSMKTDEIFTNILVQHGRKPVDGLDMGRKERLSHYGQVSGTRVEHCQEIFTPAHDNENPKSILLTGKPGIGKTLFCQKLIRDWADDNLFQPQRNAQIPNFKFAYLLTFRQLNLLGDERVTLREILNCSSVLDDHSNIDDSLFDYIVNHSEEVLIIIDGYDEYSEQEYIAGNLDERYPNNAQEKMPVAALCTKLIKRKILRDSVVMITSRPDESDKIDRIRFDRYVEITGFSEQQVKEYIEKYFKENENMKNTVLDHITKNDDLVSFAHIPVLCCLMCSYFEYMLKESKSTDDLPVKTSDLYFEVVDRFVRDHNKKEIPSEDTLDKLSKLAAQLLLAKRFLFVEEDMKEFSLQEVESLRASGLLHCGPPFRKSFSQTTKHFCFTHLTLHEYLAARWFVKSREIPSLVHVSSMVMQFMAGILSKEKDNEFVEQLLEQISSSKKHTDILLRAMCLAEYQDKEFANDFIKNRYHQFTDGDRGISFQYITDVDCIAISFLLDVISTLNEEKAATKHQTFSEQPFIVETLDIKLSNLTLSGIRRICKSLDNGFCAVTELRVIECNGFNDECAKCIEGLLSSKLTELTLIYNEITDAGVFTLCQALQTSTCKVTTLHLGGNWITDAGVIILCQALQTSTCKVTTLYLGGNEITDVGVITLCQVLQTSTCKVTTLSLSSNQITDAGVVTLCQTLQTSTCKVTTLDLSGNQVTDAGVFTLCQVLQTSTCKVTTLDLSYNSEITDDGKNCLRNLQKQKPHLELDFDSDSDKE